MTRLKPGKRLITSILIAAAVTAVSLLTSLTSFRALPAQAAVSAKAVTSIEDYFELPVYDEKSGEASVKINGGKPYFAPEDAAFLPEQYYGELGSLGRCTGAYALLSEELMPSGSRGSISEFEPSGWQEGYYQRSHLIAWQLTGQNIDRNLITGTELLNQETMKGYEESVAQYLTGTGNHVMYRVTPIYEGTNLVASGVLMEAQSVEDDQLCFCVYCFNVQPGGKINYKTGVMTGLAAGSAAGAAASKGTSDRTAGKDPEVLTLTPDEDVSDGAGADSRAVVGMDYVLNTNTKKFHYPYCSSVPTIKQKNRKDFTGSRDELIGMGYDPCGRCKP